MAALRLGINGLGRIGRLIVRHAVKRAIAPDAPGPVRRNRELEIVAANDITPIDELVYLLNHDSVHRWDGPRAKEVAGGIEFGPLRIKLSSEREPAKIPWGEARVDIVVESTGRFTKRAGMEQHFQAGDVKKVLLSAPGDADKTICIGVNEDILDRSKDRLVSCASCTTNALAPVLKVLDGTFGIRWGILGTVHAYTAGQGLVDSAGGKGDLRRGRAAAQNIVPTSTGAGRAMSLVLPNLAGKLEASAVRVPVPDGSMFDATCTLDGSPDLSRVLEALRDAARTDEMRGVLDVRDDPMVSSDIIGDPHSSVVDVEACLAQGPLVKVVGWYDNEFAYAQRVLDLAVVLGA